MDEYDLFIVNPVRDPIPNGDRDSVVLERSAARGWLKIGESLSEIKRILQRIRGFHGNAYVVNTNYRIPKITEDEAGSIARKVYEDWLKSGAKLDVLSEALDDVMWWTFTAEDIPAVQSGMIPGTVSIAVDKLDGHLRTPEEYSEWLKLSSL